VLSWWTSKAGTEGGGRLWEVEEVAFRVVGLFTKRDRQGGVQILVRQKPPGAGGMTMGGGDTLGLRKKKRNVR